MTMSTNESRQESTHQATLHWQFPAAAKFGRIISKDKIYQNAAVNPQLKQLFVDQVAQIKWAYKLAENTINLAKTNQVEEIEIIQIKLKTQTLDEKILTAIDKAIPHPTLFILMRDKHEQSQITGTVEMAYTAAYKKKITTKTERTANKEKWQHSQYVQSAWIETSDKALNKVPRKAQKPLPTAINLQRLYQQLLEALLPSLAKGSGTEEDNSQVKEQPEQNLEKKLAALAEIETLNKKLTQVTNKRDKEKQFNRRCELNDQYKNLHSQIEELKTQL